MSETNGHEEHDGLNCPECQAATETCKVLGAIGEAWARALDDGFFERLGAKMGEERERQMMKAILR